MAQVRSPRRLNPEHASLASIPLNDKEPPPEDSVSWRLWTACSDLAEQALQSDYMQGIKKGTLDPNQYGQYTVQDAVYCYHAEQDYGTVEQRAEAAEETQLAAFARARRDSYRSYNQETFAAWHIADPSAMALSAAAQAYVDFEHKTAAEAPPIYSVLGMIPCDQLWPWLATQLKDSAVPTNLYSFWITGNNDWGGAYRLDNFIDAWFAAHPDVYDWDRALFTFRSCMTGELNFFLSAGGQDPVPMPDA